ncbi:MAG: MFS transporter [Thermoplasmata archaeon]
MAKQDITENINKRLRLSALFVSSGGFFLDGFDLTIISFAILSIKSQMNLNAYELGLVTSAALLGAVFGALLFGYLSDKMGRKTLMGIDLIFLLIFGIISAISTNFLILFISRLLLGFGIGGDYPLSSTLISEFTPSISRGKYQAVGLSLYWIGNLVSAIVTIPLLSLGSDWWRYLFLTGALISIPIIGLRIKMAESPRWLIYKGKTYVTDKKLKEAQSKNARKYLDLFRGNLLKPTIFVTVVWFLFDVAAYGLGMYYPYTIKEFAFSSNYSTLYAIILISIAAIVAGYVISLFLIDSLGRKKLLLLGLGLMSLLLIFGGIVRISGEWLVIYYMSFVSVEQWAGLVTLFYPTELFPTSVRASAQGLATSISRVGSVIGTFFFPSMIIFLGFSHSLLLFGILSLIGFTITIFLAKETKKQTLEETSYSL